MQKTRKRLVAALAVAVSAALTVSACASSTSSGGSGKAIDVTSYEAAVKKYMAGPTSFGGPTDSVKVTKGIKLAIIPCAVSIGGCNQPAEAVKGVAATLGWTTTVLDGQSNPRTQNQMIQNAVSSGANAIVTVAVDYNLVQQGLSAAKKAGIPVISMNDGIGSPNPAVSLKGQLGFDVDVSPDYVSQGKMVADWMIADSKGKANVLMVITKDYLSNIVAYTAFQEEMKKCTSCTVNSPLTFTTSEIASGSLGTRAAGSLRTNKKIDYVYVGFDAAAAGVVTSIKQAGLSKQVKLASFTADDVNRDLIRKQDVQHADVIEIPIQSAYAAVDQTLRLLAKQPVFEPNNEGMGAVLLTKDNMIANGTGWKLPFDVASEYKKIWLQG